MNDNSARVIEVDIDEILPNRFQPRIQFDEEEILELSDSIKEHGVIQPIVVRPIGDKYEIIAGERRYKASVLAGKETVPVIVKNLNDKDSAEVALIENVQRKNLTPIEEALSYKKILDMGYITQEQLAEKLGKSQSSIANKIRLLNLTDDVQEALLESKISERHARSLLKLSTSALQNKMLNRIINERLTVRRTDEEIEKLKNDDLNNEIKLEMPKEEEKRIEKEGINMNNSMNNNINNNMNTMSNNTQGFDIFGSMPNNAMPQQDLNQPQSFDIFSNPTQNVSNMQPLTNDNQVNQPQSIGQMPTMEGYQSFNSNIGPIAPTEPISSNMNQAFNNQFAPQDNVVPQNNTLDTSIPKMEGISFDLNSINPINQSTVEPTMPNMPNTMNDQYVQVSQPQVITPQPQTTMPETSPIIDNTKPLEQQNTVNTISPDLFSFGTTPQDTPQENTNTSNPNTEFKMPEPIIITDYNKQYDPVMPQQQAVVAPTVDFKEVINTIRECSAKIEKYGYKIDVEEYDLANLYQVVFKIEK